LVVERSLTDPKYFDHIRQTIGVLILQQKPLPDPYRYWLNSYLTDGILPPKRPRGRIEKPHAIERVVCLVSELVEIGLPPTRNDEASIRESACDVVAAALKSLGKQPQSFSRVKRIWLENKDRVFE
jgi:hypothetical protein